MFRLSALVGIRTERVLSEQSGESCTPALSVFSQLGGLELSCGLGIAFNHFRAPRRDIRDQKTAKLSDLVASRREASVPQQIELAWSQFLKVQKIFERHRAFKHLADLVTWRFENGPPIAARGANRHRQGAICSLFVLMSTKKDAR